MKQSNTKFYTIKGAQCSGGGVTTIGRRDHGLRRPAQQNKRIKERVVTMSQSPWGGGGSYRPPSIRQLS